MSTPLNLRQLAREVAEHADDLDYPALTAALLKAIPPGQQRHALAQALPAFMREIVVSMRQSGRVHPPTAATLPTSWKQEQIRDGWQKRGLEIYATEAGNKHLFDFTYDDLVWQSELLTRQAKSKMARAKGWRDLADLLKEHDAATVRDLPAEVLMVTLGAVA